MSFPISIFSDFASAFAGLFSADSCEKIFAEHGPRGAGKPKLSNWQWIMARVYHEFARIGSFSASVKEITRVTISDSALSQRAASIGWELLDRILPQVLHPLADIVRHPEAFYRGYRLLAFDGYRFNMRNTPAVTKRARKVPCSKGGKVPAFAHMLGVALVEIGHHQPLGASFGWQGEGELTLTRKILAKRDLPEYSLLLADRLFGTPLLLWEMMPMLERTLSALLFRVRSNIKGERVGQLSDGSWLVDIKVNTRKPRKKLGTIRVREIHADITFEGESEPLPVRFWTTLLDPTEHPAATLVELYAKRWEEELFFRELKSHLHDRGNLLDAQSPETAAQECLAMLLAASLVAMQREEVAQRAGVGILQISFAKVYQKSSALFEILAVGRDLIPPEAIAELLERVLEDLKTSALIKKRKPRSCPRTIRQPTKDWPKTKTPGSKPLIKIITITNP